MGKSTAERQREYRARRKNAHEGEGEQRLNLWIRTGAALALGRVARRYGVTKREMLERLVAAADEEELEGMDPYSEEWREYFGETTGGADGE